MMPLATVLAGLMTRELVSVRKEIEAYEDEADLWRAAPGIVNPGGTLALHLAGNLQHFIGAVLGGTGYRRDRDAEFAARNLPRAEVIRQIDAAIAAVEATLPRLTTDDLGREYPLAVGTVRVETGEFLVHLQSHLAYHLGQLDYHRRLVSRSGTTLSTVAPGRLRSAREAT